MASIFQRGECLVLQFTGADNKRRTLSLPGATEKVAAKVLHHIEARIGAAKFGLVEPAETRAYFAKLPAALAEKLDAVGLLLDHEQRHRQAADITLVSFYETTIAAHPEWKRFTLNTHRQTVKKLSGFFADKRLVALTAEDVIAFRSHCRGTLGLNENTVRGHIKNLKAILEAAVRSELIEKNPAAGQSTAIGNDEGARRFITPEMAQRVLAACPGAKWRAIFALARWGGLRIPSEIQGLKWEHILWDEKRFRIFSPKLENDAAGGWRECPLFPEVELALREWHMEAPPGESMFPSTDKSSNLRTTFCKIIRKAGYTPWPKLFVNLRSSRATELAQLVPGYVCVKWLGHSERVANKHYRTVLDSHYEIALQPALQLGGKMDPFGPAVTPILKDLSAFVVKGCTPQESNLQPTVPKTVALSN